MGAGGEGLPGRFPIFPLRGALLLPGGSLPLNIFEPRYLQMVRDAMQTDRVIGMVQPRAGLAERGGADMGAADVYATGCAGRITTFEETPDGRYLIVLAGLVRFDVVREVETDAPYREIEASFERWRGDLGPAGLPEGFKPELVAALRVYFARQDFEVDWEAVETAPLPGLVTSLAMICPFEPNEKQALLEAPDLEAQGRMLVALMQMSALDTDAASVKCH
ncbi:MAG: LON peptidase substrate-binding domain-containing protein [Geminicoccaceae bacterium]|nr:LON peptidase substrate-binding domain-containing protein [Geminicoccaceae bacterium]